MRERLIELLGDAQREWLNEEYEHTTEKSLAEYVADILISNGVTVNEIVVGQIIYRYDFDDMVHPVKEYVCTDVKTDGYFIVQNKNNFSDRRRLNYSSLQSNCFYFSKEDAERMVKSNVRNTAKFVVKNGKPLSRYCICRENLSIWVENILFEDKLYFVVYCKDEHGNEKIHLCNQVRIDVGE